MWYEILPSVVIIGGALMVPMYAAYYVNKAVLGSPMHRDLSTPWDRLMFLRDIRLTNDTLKGAGLENIPDE